MDQREAHERLRPDWGSRTQLAVASAFTVFAGADILQFAHTRIGESRRGSLGQPDGTWILRAGGADFVIGAIEEWIAAVLPGWPGHTRMGGPGALDG
jgi:hypothetical protein